MSGILPRVKKTRINREKIHPIRARQRSKAERAAPKKSVRKKNVIARKNGFDAARGGEQFLKTSAPVRARPGDGTTQVQDEGESGEASQREREREEEARAGVMHYDSPFAPAYLIISLVARRGASARARAALCVYSRGKTIAPAAA